MTDLALYEEIDKARKILGLFDSATIPEVEKRYKELLLKWHPDKNRDNIEQATEMTSDIISSYKIIMDYFMIYKIPFSKKEVNKYLSGEEWWLNKFGTDPLWSNNK